MISHFTTRDLYVQIPSHVRFKRLFSGRLNSQSIRQINCLSDILSVSRRRNQRARRLTSSTRARLRCRFLTVIAHSALALFSVLLSADLHRLRYQPCIDEKFVCTDRTRRRVVPTPTAGTTVANVAPRSLVPTTDIVRLGFELRLTRLIRVFEPPHRKIDRFDDLHGSRRFLMYTPNAR